MFLVDLFDSSQLIELARDRIEGVIALGGGGGGRGLRSQDWQQ